MVISTPVKTELEPFGLSLGLSERVIQIVQASKVIFLLESNRSHTSQTDRQTDGQTDGRVIQNSGAYYVTLASRLQIPVMEYLEESALFR